jgi:hypothetical protein
MCGTVYFVASTTPFCWLHKSSWPKLTALANNAQQPHPPSPPYIMVWIILDIHLMVKFPQHMVYKVVVLIVMPGLCQNITHSNPISSSHQLLTTMFFLSFMAHHQRQITPNSRCMQITSIHITCWKKLAVKETAKQLFLKSK